MKRKPFFKLLLKIELLVSVLFFCTSQYSISQILPYIRPNVSFTIVNSEVKSQNEFGAFLVHKATNSYYANRYNNIPIKSTSIEKNAGSNYSDLSKQHPLVSKEMFSYIFNFNNNSFNYDKVFELAKHSATDNQLKIGTEAMDSTRLLHSISEEMIGKTFIVSIVVRRFETMEQYYNRMNTPTNSRVNYGYYAEVEFFVSRILITPEKLDEFYSSCWIEENSNKEEKAIRLKNYNQFTLSTELVYSEKITGFSVQRKLYRNHPKYGRTLEELVEVLPDNLIGKLVAKLSLVNDEFALTSTLSSTYPCLSKIGEKEGIYIAERFFAYEKIIKPNGTIRLKRKGVLRAQKLIDNKNNPSLTSQFQQQGGSKLYPGIIIKEMQHSHFNTIISYSHEYYDSQINFQKFMIGISIGPVGRTKKSQKLKNRFIGLNYGFNTFRNVKYLKADSTASKGFGMPVQLDIGREFYFTRKGNIFLYSSAAFGVTFIAFTSDLPNVEKRSPLMGSASLRLGIGLHVSPKISLLILPLMDYNFVAIERSQFQLTNPELIDESWRVGSFDFKRNLYNNISLRISF